MPLFSTHTFTVPYSNPFPMFRMKNGERVYSHFDDKRNAVQGRSYTQVWKSSDMLSFQCSWYRISLSANMSVTFRILEDGEEVFDSTRAISSEGYVGNLYKDFMCNKSNGDGTVNGVYVFSKRVSDFTSSGHCIKVELTDPDGNIWESDTMLVDDSVKGTKLIHYNQTCGANETVFDTYFGMMVYGYDIRLHGKYTGSESAMEAEKITGYDGGVQMVSATPVWKTKMELGVDGVGLPSYYLMLMTMVAACDTKTVDDYGAFELDGADFQKQSFDDYDNEFYSAPIRLKSNTFGSSVTGDRNTRVFVDYTTRDDSANGAEVTVETDGGRWYIDRDFTDANIKEIDTLAGGSGITVVRIGFGYSSSEETNTIAIRDAETDDVIAEFTLVTPRTKLGLNHMSIGDTFIISGERSKSAQKNRTKKF